MIKVAIFTTTRAEFGLFLPLLNELKKSNIDYLLFVGGTHLCSEHGKTITEIESHNISITSTFDYLLNENGSFAIAKSAGIATIELSHLFENYTFDFVCILGDRFELISIIQVAILYRKPIIHIHGGERTEGAIDEQIRHCITKAAHIHFVSCNEYAQNVRKLGESDWRICNTGSLGIDNIVLNTKISKTRLFQELGLNPEIKTIILTYHPVTLEFKVTPLQQIKNVFSALEYFDFQVVITAPNADSNREIIYDEIYNQTKTNLNFKYCESLGVVNYLSLIPHCEFVIGNSSSGIIEVPFFKIPTINIGTRQKGRIIHDSVINVDYETDSIVKAIELAIFEDFRRKIEYQIYKFGDGTAAKKMVEFLSNIAIDEKLLHKTLDFPENE